MIPQVQTPSRLSIISLIKNRRKPFPGKCPKILILYKIKLVVLQSWLQRHKKFVLKTERINTFSYIVSILNSEKAKKSLPAAFGHIYAVCLFFSLWLLNFSVLTFKSFLQNHIKHGLTNQSFLHYIFILTLIICHHYYCLGVVEQSWGNHTNISIVFHLPQL